MPIVTNTQMSAVRLANITQARAFFPRTKKWLYPKLSGSYTSTSLVEPHAIIGSVPPLEQFNGFMKASGIPSFTMSVPNPLYKNVFKLDQTELEGDQTGTLIRLSQAAGVRLAEFPDQLFCKRILVGAQANSQYQTFRGTQYTLTFDALPIFSTTHKDYFLGGANYQSNIVQGTLPNTSALLREDDWATNALRMQRDLQLLIDKIRSVKDTQGVPLFPSFDPKESLVLVVPPILEPIATLAFKTAGSVISQTTNIAPMFVKDILTSGYLAGMRDPDTGSYITPGTDSNTNYTDFWAFIVDDWVKPFYTQLYRPLKATEMFPVGYDAATEIDRILAANSEITVDAATLFASTRVDTTFKNIGADADAYTIQNENFIVSSRWRGNMTYGPWFTAWKVIPVGGS